MAKKSISREPDAVLHVEQHAPDRMTRVEAAAYLRVSPALLAQDALTNRHKIPCIRIGRRVLYPRDMLDRWLAARVENAPAEAATV